MSRVLALAAIVALSLVPVLAAPDEFDPRDHRRLFAVRDTNAARHAIAEARNALERGETIRGLLAAQRVLDDMPDDFFLVEAASDRRSVLWRSAAEVVREILEGLDDRAREAYKSMVMPSTRPLIARALRTQGEATLRTVLRRYGASSAGTQVARLLADVAAEQARWRDAARYAWEGLRFAPRDPGLWARLVDALAASGDRRGLEELEPPPDLSFQTVGRPARITERVAQALVRLPDESRQAGWPMWGGNAARNRQFPVETPMPTRLRWAERTDFQERRNDRRSWNGPRRGMAGGDEEMLKEFRPLHPAVQGRTVFVSDGRSVRAHDIYSGRRMWVFDSRTESRLALAGVDTVPHGRTSVERAFAPVVAGDLVIATVEVALPYRPEFLQAVEISAYLPRRIIVALDRETGAMRWWMGHEGVAALTLPTTSIVSPPVVADGLVIALGSRHEGLHKVALLAFDLRTGALRWRRSLGFGQQELNLFGEPVKELAAGPVAVADGVAYVSTGLGFVAAVDIHSGVPRWLASYEIIPVPQVEFWYAARVRTPKMAPAPPVVQGDVVVVAPTDGLHVHAFDRRTGRLLWREAYVTDQIAYRSVGHFLGVTNDGNRDVVLLTDHELRARDLQTGKFLWSGRFDPEGDEVIGRGAVAGGEILVPTATGLQRFSLTGDGAYRGTVPWPEGAAPGNLLALGRVLLVASRDTLQWFYDWAAIERDVERRRRERPDDPTILLEAGEMFLRGGGETERALKAFEEARRVAHRSRPEAEPRAVRGLYDTWLMTGDQRVTFPERAVEAYRRALTYAQTAEERVVARLHIHKSIMSGGDDPQALVQNLVSLVEEASEAHAVFDADEGEVPAKAAALFLLADAHVAAGGYEDAVDAYQRVLAESRDAAFPDGPAHVRAREGIARILDEHGPSPYRKHEERAQTLLTRAEREGHSDLLEHLLDGYPNAAVVPDALLARGRTLLGAGKPVEAARYLRRLLAESPNSDLAPAAVAGLVRAYRIVGAKGAARFALARLSRAHASDRFDWDGRSWTGTEFAAAERSHLGAPRTSTPVSGKLRAPLREVAFEPVGDDDLARPIGVVTDETRVDGPVDAPVALMMRGQELVAIDLRAGKVAWSTPTGHCQRAVYDDDTLVVAVSQELRGLDAGTGRELWSRETDAIIRDMQIAHGQVFALVQDLSGLGGAHRLFAIDAFTGIELWSADLGREDYRALRPWRDQLLLTHYRLRRSTSESSLLVFDGFSGTPRHRMRVPMQMEGTAVIEGRIYCVAGREPSGRSRALAAYDLETGQPEWQRALKGRDAICALSAEAPHLLVLRGDGSVVTHALRDGAAVHETRIFVGDVGRACPFPGTPLLTDADSLTLFPWVRRPALSVVSYDRGTGKLRWEVPYEADIHPSKAVVVRRDGVLCVLISYPRDNVQNILVRLLDANTGKLLQEIEPEGLARANWIPSMVEGHGTLVIFGKSGASIFRAAP